MGELEKENTFWVKFYGWFLTVVGLFMVAYATKDLSEISKIKKNSVIWQAEITKVSLDSYRISGRSSSNWIIDYRFEVPSGKIYDGREILDEYIQPFVRVGDSQTIYYYKNNPSINRTKASMHNKKSVLTVLVGIIFSVLGVKLLRKVKNNI